ncbi:MAG: hypothetical protein GY761_19745, partial [Hyphomicrobiales bacterium]|nr:hypothetical protein [Hyphomicrobiales bacterium]
MSTSAELMYAILAMDAYNQGYGAGLNHPKNNIGFASKITDSSLVFEDPNADPDDPTPDEA